MTGPNDTQTYVNDSATSSPARTKPTQERSGFDLADTRRDLIALAVKHGADTPIGHRAYTLVKLIENLRVSTDGWQKSRLVWSIHRINRELAGLLAAAR
jgi:hypothetical protein